MAFVALVRAGGAGTADGEVMRLAILGTRGIPARYGGFETFAEELSARLAGRGHTVTVFTRSHFAVTGVREHRGATVRVLPAIRTKHLETISHTLLSCLWVSRREFDVVLLCNAANAPLIPLLHARSLPVAINVDGIERKRRKWGRLAHAYYRRCERLAARWAEALVTDAEVIRRYYRRAWRRESVMIPYGGDLPRPTGQETLRRLGLQASGYLLYVSRFEPENNPDRVAAAYLQVPGDVPLVMVGGAPYADELVRRIQSIAARDRRILLPGPTYGEGYRELLYNARAYVHATEIGGTHPALVEAMGAGLPVCYLDNPPNREVVGGAGLAFDFSVPDSLPTQLAELLAGGPEMRSRADAARARVAERYRWDDVATAYERLLEGLCCKNQPA
jgi:glycosyltransferase involved in cell wall biosynthesis